MEEVKIGTWANGKPLYRKILNVELPIYDSTSSYGGKSVGLLPETKLKLTSKT